LGALLFSHPTSWKSLTADFDDLVISPLKRHPGGAGVQNFLDSGFCQRNDRFYGISTFYEIVNFPHGQILPDRQKYLTKKEGSGIRPEIMKARISFQPPEEKTVVFCGRFV